MTRIQRPEFVACGHRTTMLRGIPSIGAYPVFRCPRAWTPDGVVVSPLRLRCWNDEGYPVFRCPRGPPGHSFHLPFWSLEKTAQRTVSGGFMPADIFNPIRTMGRSLANRRRRILFTKYESRTELLCSLGLKLITKKQLTTVFHRQTLVGVNSTQSDQSETQIIHLVCLTWVKSGIHP
jgi:hypothetical protein